MIGFPPPFGAAGSDIIKKEVFLKGGSIDEHTGR
jgi:hypothetical protein